MNSKPFGSDFALNALIAPPSEIAFSSEVAESVYLGEGYDERKMLAQYASNFTSKTRRKRLHDLKMFVGLVQKTK